MQSTFESFTTSSSRGKKIRARVDFSFCGFDPHRRDPLGGMGVTEEGFAGMAELLVQLADQHADGKIAFLLEGGYDLTALRNSVAAVLRVMQQQTNPQDTLRPGGDSIKPLIQRIEQVREKYR